MLSEILLWHQTTSEKHYCLGVLFCADLYAKLRYFIISP